jgi:cell wall-associated NlpC family hydrolase
MSLVDDVIATAHAQLGKAYVLGTEGPTTFDCSGLVWYCFDQNSAGALIGGSRRKAAGYTRWAADNGQFTRDFRQAERGDLLVYEHPVGHVALYLGGGEIISALIPPYGVRQTAYNRISVPFYGVVLVDYGAGRTGSDGAPDTVGTEPDSIFPADPDWDAALVELPRGRALFHIEFEDRPRRAMGGTDVVNKITRRRPVSPPPSESTVADDSPLSLDVWQLKQDNIDFAETRAIYGSTDITSHAFTYSHVTGAATVSVGSDIEGEVLWPWADCGGLMPAWTGETRYEAWAEIDLSGGIPDDWLGLRCSGTGADWGIGPSNYGTVAGATPTADQQTYIIGWGIPDPTAPGQFTPVAMVNVFEDWSVFIPRSLLVGGVDNALVIAPSWVAAGWYCQQDLNDPGPGEHRPAIDGSGGSAVGFVTGTDLASVVPVILSGTGKSQWVPGDGAVDGSNAEYALISWDGTGTPEARVDDVILAAADYTFDAGALTVTFREPPASGAAVAFRYNVGP